MYTVWESPVSPDRGGSPDDSANFVSLCREMKRAFNLNDPGWELTVSVPLSYEYLQGFDLDSLRETVDFFNVMAYDVHGPWDQRDLWSDGKTHALRGHTNLTEIENGLNLLWRNSVPSSQVVMGYSFFSRGMTLSDTQCTTPGTCSFTAPSYPGDCTNTLGLLSYQGKRGKHILCL